ncbi:MAG: hypothetical protein LBR40_05615, partial [Bacilli bacterium]|nr:hypothetical protein [Bacilli bacterium]
LYNNNNISNYYYKERDLLLNKLIEAKQDAINNKSITYLRFNNNELIIQNNKNIKKIIFKNIQFQSSGELFFNKNGNINQGKTINMIMNYKLHKIVFYLGKGWFKIE